MTSIHLKNTTHDGIAKPRKFLSLPKFRRRLIYVIAVGSWITGGLWLIYHYFVKVVDEFGFEGPHPFEKWFVIVHAAFAFFALWMFGSLWHNHIKVGWRLKRSRWSGGALFAVICWMAISGYLLYYLGDARLKEVVSLTHWIPGLAGIVLFLIHIFAISFRKRRP